MLSTHKVRQMTYEIIWVIQCKKEVYLMEPHLWLSNSISLGVQSSFPRQFYAG